MPRRVLLVLGAVLLSLAGPAVAIAGPAAVTVRVEGISKTLVPTVQVTTNAALVDKTAQGGTTCSGTSAGGALQLATGGNWSGRIDGGVQSVEQILGETYPVGSDFAGRRWQLDLNDGPAPLGPCQTELTDGDEVLFYPVCAGAGTSCFSQEPLDLKAPATIRPNQSFTVTVQEADTQYGLGPSPITTKVPSSGATVSVLGTATAKVTDAAGQATLSLPTRGTNVLVATKGGHVREPVTVCVTDGTDGVVCPAPSIPVLPFPIGPACQTNGQDGLCGTVDRTPPTVFVRDIAEQQSFAHGEGPRELHAFVSNPEPAGLRGVKMRLTRDNGRCMYYSGRSEHFRANRQGRCGARYGYWFGVGTDPDTRYVLRSRLGPGRYVLDVNAIDKAFNRDDTRVRTRNRVVFRVA